jgi:DNA-binding transcriptional regulator PaaX
MAADRPARGPGEWVLLSYRLPREPSTPRIAVWRKLKRLGVAQLSDGLVALPADARTREQLEWIADEAIEAGGTASIWLARPASLAQERGLATGMADARAAEYQAVIDQAAETASSGADTAAAVRRLRAELRRIGRRDFFPPPERDRAHATVRALTDKPDRAAADAAVPDDVPPKPEHPQEDRT